MSPILQAVQRYSHIVVLVVIGVFTQTLMGAVSRSCDCVHDDHAAIVHSDVEDACACHESPAPTPAPSDEVPDGCCECPLPCCMDVSKTIVATPAIVSSAVHRVRPPFGVMCALEAMPYDGSLRLLRPPRTRSLV